MIITNIYLRVLFGSFTIFIGMALLKIVYDKDKKSIWGHLYRAGEEMFNARNRRQYSDKVYIILGWLSIAAGSIAIFYGFRMRMVGY